MSHPARVDMSGAGRALRLTCLCGAFLAIPALAHEVGGRDAAFVAATREAAPAAFAYLGAKHMVTGLDHLLFLLGVIFFLWRPRDILLYVSLFSLGHSLTLLAGVWWQVGVDARLVDAAIGLSVAYKAFDNLSGFDAIGLPRPDPGLAVFCFGLVHGLGLAAKLLELRLHREGLLANLLSFNLGVEVGQATALALVLLPLLLWRRHASFGRFALVANVAMMIAGFLLVGQHLAGFLLDSGGKA